MRRPTWRSIVYVEAVWLPNHRMELTARADYTPAIYRHIMWFFGPVKMREIGPARPGEGSRDQQRRSGRRQRRRQADR